MHAIGVDLLPPGELPEGFAYTSGFLAFVEEVPAPIEPWFVMTGSILSHYQGEVLVAYPDRKLVAFARRLDRGLFAAFDAASEGEIVVRSLAGSGEPDLLRFPTLGSWVSWAVGDAGEKGSIAR